MPTNRSLIRLSTNEDNELTLINKRGEVVSKIDICSFVANCETTTSLAFNDTTGVLTYTNEDGVANTINLCGLFNICSQANSVPPFCITNLPVPGNPSVLPSPTVIDFGCEGATTVHTYIRSYDSIDLVSYNDVLIATPIDLSFLCNQQSTFKVEIVTVVTNACGTYTDIQLLPVNLEFDIVTGYFGISCCVAEISDIMTTNFHALDDAGFTNLFYVVSIITDTTWTRDKDLNNTYVIVSYNNIYTNGHTALNYGGVISYDIYNGVYNTYNNPHGIEVLTTGGNTIGVYTSQTNSQDINTACDSHVLTIQSFDVVVPPTGVNPDGVVVDLASLIVMPPNITTPLEYRFVYNGIVDNVVLYKNTGILNIPYSVPVWATAKAVINVSTYNPTKHTHRVLAIAVLNAIQ